MGKYASYAIVLLLVLGAGFSLAQTQPREVYRDIYNLITKAEESLKAGNSPDAADKFREISVRLKSFQQQYPDWEPDIVRFRLMQAEAELSKLGGVAPVAPTPVAQAPAPAPVAPAPVAPAPVAPAPTPAPIPAPTYYQSENIRPVPAAPVQQPAPQAYPYPAPQQQYAPPPAYNPPVAQAPAPTPRYVAPAPQPQPNPVTLQDSTPYPTSPKTVSVNTSTDGRTGGLQALARQVESELGRLMDENRELRSALSDAESRAAVANNYMKVLTRENQMLQQRLDAEVRHREALQSVLTDELNQYNSRWNALRDKIRELLETPQISQPVDNSTPIPSSQ